MRSRTFETHICQTRTLIFTCSRLNRILTSTDLRPWTSKSAREHLVLIRVVKDVIKTSQQARTALKKNGSKWDPFFSKDLGLETAVDVSCQPVQAAKHPMPDPDQSADAGVGIVVLEHSRRYTSLRHHYLTPGGTCL